MKKWSKCITEHTKNIYITMLGRSIWAVLYSYYAVLKEKQYYPDDIILIVKTISDPEQAKNLELTKKGLALTSSHFRISHIVLSEAGFTSYTIQGQ